MMIYTLPFTSAIIGWFTSWIAIKMLFRPLKPINFYFFQIQGIFPKNQALVAEKIGKMVAEELFSIHDIKEKLHSHDNLERIHKAIEARIDHYLTTDMPVKYPIMSLFIGTRARTKIKDEVMDQVTELAPEMIGGIMGNIENKIDIQETIRTKVAAFSPDMLEKMLNDILKKEFSFIEWISLILGFIIGLIQMCFGLAFPHL
jgi:uncharacterized membrane protein YheB (UPF0754 family)